MNWKSDYKLPLSFIIFFVLTFFLIGEQLSALPTYLGATPNNTVHILDKAATDALHRPLFYFLFAIIAWLAFRFLHWFLAWALSEVALSLLIHMPPEDISKLGGIRVDKFIVISVLTLAPYFTFRAIDKKWGVKGQRTAMLILVVINVLFLVFFAYQIFYLHNSHRGLPNSNSSQQISPEDKRFNQCQPGSLNNPPDCPK